MSRDHWLTNDPLGYSLFTGRPRQDGDEPGHWCPHGKAAMYTGIGLLGMLCPGPGPYRLEVGDEVLWLTHDDSGYALWRHKPEMCGVLARQWDGLSVAADDEILVALVPDGGCVKVNVEVV